MAEKPPPYPLQVPAPGFYPPQQGYNPQQPAYPFQQPGYPPQTTPYGNQPGYTNTTTIIQQPTAVLATVSFRESPVAMTCPNCRASVVTGTNYVTGTLTWLACLGLCVIGWAVNFNSCRSRFHRWLGWFRFKSTAISKYIGSLLLLLNFPPSDPSLKSSMFYKINSQ